MKNLPSLIEELDESLSKEIKEIFIDSGFDAVAISPILSGRFQSSWSIAIDGEVDQNSETNRPIFFEAEAEDFSIMSSKSIEIYNNALNDEDNESYSEFVRYDYSGSAANQILEEIEQQIYTRL